MSEILTTKDELLNKLRTYKTSPDNDTIRYKKKIEKQLITCPEFLYALNVNNLESELFDKNENINWDPHTKEPLGEWDRYFGTTGVVRPLLFIPETQTNVKTFVCYQVSFNEMPRLNSIEKYAQISFTIFVHGSDSIDELTGIPRHDLIAAILEEQINWTNIFGTQCMIISDREGLTDNNYITRTIVFQCTMPNSICKNSMVVNKIGR